MGNTRLMVTILTAFLLFSPATLAVRIPQEQAGSPPNPATSKPEVAAKPCASAANSGSKSDCNSKPKKRRKARPAKPAPATGPAKTVVHNGSTTDPTIEISPGLSEQQVSRRTQETDKLLANAENNLKTMSTRRPSSAQRDTMNQVRSYIEQARTAANSGDVQSAYNLANKASMLSADLVGH